MIDSGHWQRRRLRIRRCSLCQLQQRSLEIWVDDLIAGAHVPMKARKSSGKSNQTKAGEDDS